MKVRCQIIHSDRGYEGVIVNAQGVTVYKTDFESCAEDANGMLEGAIMRNPGWEVVPYNTRLEDMR